MSLLSAHNIAIGYPQNGGICTILSDFSLNVGQGELIGLIGPSSAGKSSLLRVLAGLSQPVSGEVKLFGQTVSQPNPYLGFCISTGRTAAVAECSQQCCFRSELCQPGLSRTQQQERVENALEEVGLQHAAGRFPSEISGGMAQRVSLARTLARHPEIWLLDELFSALDAVTRAEMQDLLRTLITKSRTSAVMVTHDIDEALILADSAVLIGALGWLLDAAARKLHTRRMH